MIAAVPSLVTLLGLGLSLQFLAGGACWLALAALTCDLLDGALARRLGVVSEFGARLDWSVDTCCAALAAGLLWRPALALLPVWWTVAETKNWRVSGRAFLFFLLVLWRGAA